ncbi:MAG: MaoC/PaaZ C-terminal domain-containing protein [Pseudomonadota bacterium]
MRYWHDCIAGETFNTDQITLSERDILEFAREFDPQPYHLDREAGDKSIFGGLCASGWQVCALMMRLLIDTFKSNDIALMGVQGVPSMRWKIPVFAGDSLSGDIDVATLEASSDRNDSGLMTCDVKVKNQKNEYVIALQASLYIAHGEQA